METKTTATTVPPKSATRNKPIIVGFDINNVLNNFTEHFIEFYNNTEKASPHTLRFEEITDWNLFECIPENNKDDALSIIMSREFYRTLPHDETAFNVLSKLNKLPNVQIALFGNRFTLDYQWVWKHFPFLRAEEVICTGITSDADIMFSDCPLEESVKYDYYLIDKPWNQDSSHSSQYTRIYDWDDIEEILAIHYNILPTLNPGTTFVNIRSDDKVPLYKKIMDCKSKEELANILEPHLQTTFTSGYTAALADIAQIIRKLSEGKEL